MRKNTQAVLEAWDVSEPKGKRGDSIWTDGNTVYSYNTWILAHNAMQNGFEVNVTKYSATTSRQQNEIQAWLSGGTYRTPFITVDNQPIGSSERV